MLSGSRSTHSSTPVGHVHFSEKQERGRQEGILHLEPGGGWQSLPSPAAPPEQDLGLLPLVPGGEDGKPPFLRDVTFSI